MDISVTRFRARCLELIREVEAGGDAVHIKRRGKVVAKLGPAGKRGEERLRPWERLRGSGKLVGGPQASVLHAKDFESAR